MLELQQRLRDEKKIFSRSGFLEELSTGTISRQKEKPLRVHAIGAVPKKNSSIQRPITDCSRPLGDSLNFYMVLENFSFESIDDALSLSAPNCFYAFVVIEKPYRQVPVYPTHRQLQSFSWNFGKTDEYFVDNCLSFGLACAPAIFHRISSAIARRMRNYKLLRIRTIFY